eukprot:3431198-Rhodomonas_salina.1
MAARVRSSLGATHLPVSTCAFSIAVCLSMRPRQPSISSGPAPTAHMSAVSCSNLAWPVHTVVSAITSSSFSLSESDPCALAHPTASSSSVSAPSSTCERAGRRQESE